MPSAPAPLQIPAKPQRARTAEYVIGVDLGQAQDPSALCVDEVVGESNPQHRIIHLERFALMTPYQEIARQVAALTRHPRMRGAHVTVVLDATGVGRPVVEMFEDQGLDPVTVTITHGFSVTKARGRPEYNVAKVVLVSAVQLVIQDSRMRVSSKLPTARVFIKEANTFSVKRTASGEASYEAWRERDHDDLVLAVAMSVWYAESELVVVPPSVLAAVAKERASRKPRRLEAPGRYFGELPRPKARRKGR